MYASTYMRPYYTYSIHVEYIYAYTSCCIPPCCLTILLALGIFATFAIVSAAKHLSSLLEDFRIWIIRGTPVVGVQRRSHSRVTGATHTHVWAEHLYDAEKAGTVSDLRSLRLRWPALSRQPNYTCNLIPIAEAV